MKKERKTALVTGASGGIGEEVAKVLAREGYDLVLVARNGDRLAKLAAELAKKHDIKTLAITRDLADPASPALIETRLKKEGIGIDLLVNNAGYADYGLFAELDLASQLGMIQVNIAALTELTRRFVGPVINKGEGKILNVASMAAFLPGPLMSIYYATKAYVLSFSEALGEELKGTGVGVTVLSPGATASGFQARAKMESSKLFKGKPVMDTAMVAEAAWRALVAGKRIVIPGLLNNVMARVPRFMPRAVMPGIVMRFQSKTD